MVAFDGDHCAREWFHLECLGLDRPSDSDVWYCDECVAGLGHGDDTSEAASWDKPKAAGIVSLTFRRCSFR